MPTVAAATSLILMASWESNDLMVKVVVVLKQCVFESCCQISNTSSGQDTRRNDNHKREIHVPRHSTSVRSQPLVPRELSCQRHMIALAIDARPDILHHCQGDDRQIGHHTWQTHDHMTRHQH